MTTPANPPSAILTLPSNQNAALKPRTPPASTLENSMTTPDQKRDRQIRTAPVSCQGILRRAIRGTASKRDAIKAMCLECIGFERRAIRECTGYACPLWRYRPYQADIAAEGVSP
jgi:hypothetical protein